MVRQRRITLLAVGCVSLVVAAISIIVIRHPGQSSGATEQTSDIGIVAIQSSGTTPSQNNANIESVGAAETLPIRDLIVFKEKEFVDLSGYPEDYEYLRSKALDGDVWAAFVLSDWLGVCEHTASPRSRVDLSEEINRFQQTHTIESYNNGEARNVRINVVTGTEDITPFVVQSMIENFERCNHVSTNTRQESERWLTYAIELERNPRFLIKLAYRKSGTAAEALYVEAWERGSSNALLQLYRTYQSRYESGEVPTDKARAFAHFLVWSEIERARKIRLGNDPVILNQVFEQQVGGVRSRLSEYELIEAEARARRLILENGNCCFIRTPSSD